MKTQGSRGPVTEDKSCHSQLIEPFGSFGPILIWNHPVRTVSAIARYRLLGIDQILSLGVETEGRLEWREASRTLSLSGYIHDSPIGCYRGRRQGDGQASRRTGTSEACRMCGRYALTVSAEQLALLFDLARGMVDWIPRYNIAPTQPAPVVRLDRDGRRQGGECRWGLIPRWAKDRGIGSRLVNARGETMAKKPAFREAFRHRRCLVPASGFFEWVGGKQQRKQPYFIHMADEQPLVMGGLWETWREPSTGQELETFTILTTTANPQVAKLHDRMPVIIPPHEFDRWLGPAELNADALREFLLPIPEDRLAMHPVSPRVNSPAQDDASLLLAIDVNDCPTAGQTVRSANRHREPTPNQPTLFD